MSDWDSNIDDELLALAGDGVNSQKSRKKRQAPSNSKSSTKRRKAELGTPSGAEPESEEDSENETPYPLEGRYKDEEDRQRLMQMSEIEREAIFAQRHDEMQQAVDKRNLDQMLKGQAAGLGRLNEEDSVSKTTKRQHTARGATKEKAKKLDELKARRRAKDEKKRAKVDSPRRERSSSPMDMETSSEEEEDGQISKLEEEDEKYNKTNTKNPDDEPITMEDLRKCWLARDVLVKHCMAPWFDEFVKGGWVRFRVAEEEGLPTYRICEIQCVSTQVAKPYKINSQSMNQILELKHGSSVKSFPMDKISNAPFQQKEFDRVVKVWQNDSLKLPTKRHIEQKVAQMVKLATMPMTESDIAAMLARKNQLRASAQTSASLTMEKARLTQARTLAIRRQDGVELAELDAKLAVLATFSASQESSDLDSVDDMLAKVNERNRKANIEAVRMAELREAERKRRERKLAAQGGGGANTPKPVIQDPSARLKTVPRVSYTASPRPGTPSTPVIAPTQPSNIRQVSPFPATPKAISLEASIDSIEVNLGDF